MLDRRDRTSIQEMLDAAEAGVRMADGRQREDLDAEDDPLPHALIRLTTVIGEAAKRVSDEGQAQLPDVRWSDATRMRDRLIHRYHDINLDIVWATVEDDLPELILLLRTALADSDED